MSAGGDGVRHRPGTAPGPAGDRPYLPLRAPAGDPTPITQVKVHTRAKSITGFSLFKPVPGFKTGYRFSGSRLTSLDRTFRHFCQLLQFTTEHRRDSALVTS